MVLRCLVMTLGGSASKDWRRAVSDSEARQVLEALGDPQWDFRTIEGLARSTGLSEGRVEDILHQYHPFIRQSAVLDRRGRGLYTLASRRPKFRELLSTARAFIAKSPLTE